MIDHVEIKRPFRDAAADIDDLVFWTQILKGLNQIRICFHAKAARAARIKQSGIGTIDRMMGANIKKAWLIDTA